MGGFDFEKLKVYNLSIDFTDRAYTIADSLPSRLQSSLGDQLRSTAIHWIQQGNASR